ncbi:MAG: SAM-dependent methyltransferase [Deltaproteobacteria bacterium]|nr:SAM-dependent methyltransferase [Kofleriaceae bacterium]
MSQPFATIRSEGGLLPPDLLARIAQGDRTVPGFTPAAYRLDDSQQFGEAISRSWNRMLPAWHAFRAELAKLSADDSATVLTREKLLQPLLQELGYGRVAPLKKAIIADDREYAISHAWGELPIHLLGAGTSLDVRTAGHRGAAKSSPHGLVQDLLNRSEPHLWALLSNGLLLRLLRDHHSLTTQAYVEVDLEALFEGERYSDFALMWLVFHQSRLEPQDDKIDRCWLEQWFTLSRTEGLQALDDLRDGVVKAIEALGRGFLKHAHNTQLVDDLREGVLDRQDYYRELLRLVYRLIFLFSAEDRGVLLDPNATELARDRYRRFYATRRLRDLAGQTRGGPHSDLWQALRAVMNGLDDGCPPLALPALGSFLWSKEAVPHLDRCELANADLLAALRALSYVERHRQRFPVSWRTVAADELGSVYESLLELHPKLDPFELITAAGNERKKTGSYYTPTSLVDCLLDSALDPVIDSAIKGKSRADAEAVLLALKVVDPACGSGHFLVAAARRLARRLATVRTGDDEPSPRELQHALRDVVGRCVYGVDLNEMAVELCKVALWMEAVEPGKPLSFLDAHVQHGNALLGATPALIARGIADDAWDPIEGDDKAVARALKKRNREARKAAEKSGQTDVFGIVGSPGGSADLAAAARDALTGADEAVADIRARKRRWEALQSSQAFRDAVLVADTWCAAYVWPKQDGQLAAEAPTHEAFVRVLQDPSTASKPLRREVGKLAGRYTFFHWHLAFPEVFQPRDAIADDDVIGWDGGFDCVLGNPPWERVKLQEAEWFAARRPDVAMAPNSRARKALIASLADDDPTLHADFREAYRRADGESAFLRRSLRFPLCGRGEINSYGLFAECSWVIARSQSACGVIVPSGILTDETTKLFFNSIQRTRALVQAVDFENNETLFPGVGHGRMRFCLLSLRKGSAVTAAKLFFLARSVADLAEADRWFTLTAEDAATINPNSKTCPIFLSRRDAEMTREAYARFPVMRRDAPEASPWGASLNRMFDMTHDGDLVRPAQSLLDDGWKRDGREFVRNGERMLPIIEGKMVTFYDHRAAHIRLNPDAPSRQQQTKDTTDQERSDAGFFPDAYLWAPADEARRRFHKAAGQDWAIALKRVTSATNWRTMVACVVPDSIAVSYTLYVVGVDEEHKAAQPCLLAMLNSFAYDYFVRQKTMQPSLPVGPVYETVMPPPAAFKTSPPWLGSPLARWVAERVGELVCVSHDLSSFARTIFGRDVVFTWKPERREFIQAELDAMCFHLFGFSQADVDHVLRTFPKVREYDMKAHGEFRTRNLILQIYDTMAGVVTGGTYRSALSPPPGDLRAAQDSREGAYVPQVPSKPASNILPLPLPPRTKAAPVLPRVEDVPDLAKSRPRSWERPRADHAGEIGATIAAVLKKCARATDLREVRLAALLCLEPHLLGPMLDANERKAWGRVIGADAKRSMDASIEQTLKHWGEALRGLRARGRLTEDQATSTWAPGDDIQKIDTRGWPDDRAAFVVHVLSRARHSNAIETVVLAFPTTVRDWVLRAA